MADVSVTLTGVLAMSAAGHVRALPRPVKIGTPAMALLLIPPPR